MYLFINLIFISVICFTYKIDKRRNTLSHISGKADIVLVREQDPSKLKKCLNMRGQAGNGIFSKFRFPKVILRQKKI